MNPSVAASRSVGISALNLLNTAQQNQVAMLYLAYRDPAALDHSCDPMTPLPYKALPGIKSDFTYLAAQASDPQGQAQLKSLFAESCAQAMLGQEPVLPRPPEPDAREAFKQHCQRMLVLELRDQVRDLNHRGPA